MTAVVAARAARGGAARRATQKAGAAGFDERVDLRTEKGRARLAELENASALKQSPAAGAGSASRSPRASSGQRQGASFGRSVLARPQRQARAVVSDGAGLILGLFAYAVLVAFLEGGPDGLRRWLAAKFINAGAQPAAGAAGFGQIGGSYSTGTPAAGQLVFPVAGAQVSYRDDFGEPRGGGRRHQGNDIMAPLGAPVRAAFGGVVRDGFSNRLGGVKVTVLGDDGRSYYYAHLQEGSVAVQAGQRVRAGDLLGKVGQTGNASGPHLHFSINEGRANNVNPFAELQEALR